MSVLHIHIGSAMRTVRVLNLVVALATLITQPMAGRWASSAWSG